MSKKIIGNVLRKSRSIHAVPFIASMALVFMLSQQIYAFDVDNTLQSGTDEGVSSIQDCGDYLGTVWASDGLSNIPVTSKRISYRFEAEETASITSFKWAWQWESGDTGYNKGNGGGPYLLTVHADNAGQPGTALGSTLHTTKPYTERWPDQPFTTPVPVVANSTYHIVIANQHSAPDSNFMSINGPIVYGPKEHGLHPMPCIQQDEFAILSERYASSGFGMANLSYGSWTELFDHQITYDNGQYQGNGYYNGGPRYARWLVQGKSKIRQSVESDDVFTTNDVFLRTHKWGGDPNSDLVIKLQNASGATIDQCTIPEQEVYSGCADKNGRCPNRGKQAEYESCSWSAGPHTLAAGNYFVELSASAGDPYWINLVLQGSSHSIKYNPAVYQSRGHAQVSKNGGASWSHGYTYYGGGSHRTGDLQMFLPINGGDTDNNTPEPTNTQTPLPTNTKQPTATQTPPIQPTATHPPAQIPTLLPTPDVDPERFFENFDSIEGSLNGVAGWVSNGVAVESVPTERNNRALAISGARIEAYRALPVGIAESENGLVHFRIKRTGDADVFVGLSDLDEPNQFPAYEVQFGSQYGPSLRYSAPDKFMARDGNEAHNFASTFSPHVWYCVWLIVDNRTDTYQPYIAGGEYTELTSLNKADNINFRNGTRETLQTLYVRTGGASSKVFIDDILVKPSANIIDIDPASCISRNNVEHYSYFEGFDTLSQGPLNGQAGWISNNMIVQPDSSEPENVVLLANTQNASTYKTLPDSISKNGTGTLHFRMKRTGNAEINIGFAIPHKTFDFHAYAVQLGARPTSQGQAAKNTFTMHDKNLSRNSQVEFDQSAWYCVWVVIDNSTDTYSAYVKHQAESQITQLTVDKQEHFSFHNEAPGAIDTLYIRTSTDGSAVHIDDIHLDADQANLSSTIPSCVAETAALVLSENTVLENSIWLPLAVR